MHDCKISLVGSPIIKNLSKFFEPYISILDYSKTEELTNLSSKISTDNLFKKIGSFFSDLLKNSPDYLLVDLVNFNTEVLRRKYSDIEISSEQIENYLVEQLRGFKEDRIIVLDYYYASKCLFSKDEYSYIVDYETYLKEIESHKEIINLLKQMLPTSHFISITDSFYCDIKDAPPSIYSLSNKFYNAAKAIVESIISSSFISSSQLEKYVSDYKNLIQNASAKDIQLFSYEINHFSGEIIDIFDNHIISNAPISKLTICGKNNIIDLSGNIILENTVINMRGDNNILCADTNGSHIKNSDISFYGNNSLIYFSSNNESHSISCEIYNNSVVFLGKNTGMNGSTRIICGEEKNVFIGDNCLISDKCAIRTDDAHQVYDSVTFERVNVARSVYIGDNVWIGSDSKILKGSHIHSGTLIGTGSVVTGKTYFSGCAYGGNPARLIRSNIIIDRSGTHSLTKNDILPKEKLIERLKKLWFSFVPSDYVDFDSVDTNLLKSKTARKKLEFLNNLNSNSCHNRFSLNEPIKNE